jgi:predicted MFS family arabinose efflux permease
MLAAVHNRVGVAVVLLVIAVLSVPIGYAASKLVPKVFVAQAPPDKAAELQKRLEALNRRLLVPIFVIAAVGVIAAVIILAS